MFENFQCASCTLFFLFFVILLLFLWLKQNFPFFVYSKLFLNILYRRYNCKVPVHRQHIFVLNSYVKTVIYRFTFLLDSIYDTCMLSYAENVYVSEIK